jgi:hypothetical protein
MSSKFWGCLASTSKVRKAVISKLRREIDDHDQTVTVPNHRELDPGICRAIFRQAGEYIPEAELAKYFYTE